MMKARLLTIGTEITAGEVVNSNASWISERLEDMGVRVFSHLTVRDQREEILAALEYRGDEEILIITGGLGPTSDDLTRAVVAEAAGRTLEFDEAVWRDLITAHEGRGLPVREAHRHQCYFPAGAERLPNAAGTALGFTLKLGSRVTFAMPGPPRELATMWEAEVAPRLKAVIPPTSRRWVRWTCIGAPESEVAELVEPVIAGRDIEVGYRAQVPYVKVKVYVDPERDAEVIARLDSALDPHVVSRERTDLAEELLRLWPAAELNVVDQVTETNLITRLLGARRARGADAPEIFFFGTKEPAVVGNGIVLNFAADELQTELHLARQVETDKRRLPFKLKLDSERGRRAAAEWAIWACVKHLRALER